MQITIKHNEIRSCALCKYHYAGINDYPCNKCIHNATDRFTPMTNFDKIKGMSVEELAKFLATPCECDVDPKKDGCVECGNELCIERIVKWLNSNVI
jgi:hypothetical protein